jgi:hypothetical protein
MAWGHTWDRQAIDDEWADRINTADLDALGRRVYEEALAAVEAELAKDSQ